MDVRVHVKRRLGQRLAGGVVGDRDAPDRAALMASTDRGHTGQIGVGLGCFTQEGGEFFKLDEAVVGEHGTAVSKA